MRSILTSLLLLFLPVTLSASVKDIVAQADSAFYAEKYEAAGVLYTAAIDSLEATGQTPASDIFYNYGNACYRQNLYPAAVLAYLRALRINPSNTDAAKNLEIVRSRLTDHFNPPTELFFISWMKDTIASGSVEKWTSLAACCVVLFFIFLAIYLYGRSIAVRKMGFTLALLNILCLGLMVTFACMQRNRYYHNNQAVMFAAETKMYASPTANSKQIMTLHEGCTVILNDDNTTKGWMNITLPDGREGWMPDKGYHRVVEKAKKN